MIIYQSKSMKKYHKTNKIIANLIQNKSTELSKIYSVNKTEQSIGIYIVFVNFRQALVYLSWNMINENNHMRIKGGGTEADGRYK